MRKLLVLIMLFAVSVSLISCASVPKTYDLLIASGRGDIQAVKALLAKGASVNVQTKEGATALIFAAQNGYIDIVKALLAKGAEMNVQTKTGETALILASFEGHTDIVEVLLAKGAGVNVQTKAGGTALMAASFKGHTDIVKALLAKGVDMNVQDKAGVTALMFASQRGHKEIVQLLWVKPRSSAAGQTAVWTTKHKDKIDLRVNEQGFHSVFMVNGAKGNNRDGIFTFKDAGGISCFTPFNSEIYQYDPATNTATGIYNSNMALDFNYNLVNNKTQFPMHTVAFKINNKPVYAIGTDSTGRVAYHSPRDTFWQVATGCSGSFNDLNPANGRLTGNLLWRPEWGGTPNNPILKNTFQAAALVSNLDRPYIYQAGIVSGKDSLNNYFNDPQIRTIAKAKKIGDNTWELTTGFPGARLGFATTMGPGLNNPWMFNAEGVGTKPFKIPCEEDCKKMFKKGQLREGMTVEECIKILCK